MNIQHIFLYLLILLVAACGGSSGGSGSDPTTTDTTTQTTTGISQMEANFPSIQANLFTPTCAVSGCHLGATAPEGLQLSAGNSYALLVGVPSGGVPAVDRVVAGDPGNSYLIWKLEGRSGIQGQRMPRGGPFLTQAQIDIVAQWISDGALQASAMSGPAELSVKTISPARDSFLTTSPNVIVIGFNDELDKSTVGSTAFAIKGSGGDETFNDGNEFEVPLALTTLAKSNTKTVILTPKQTQFRRDAYQITVKSQSGYSVQSLQSKILAADFTSYFYID